jgi:quercetin dioxygenase-like cupin family protein
VNAKIILIMLPFFFQYFSQVFVYMLEGEVVMQVKGGQKVTLKPGDTFYKNPDDIHKITQNASKSKPARFLVYIIKKKGAPALVPRNE